MEETKEQLLVIAPEFPRYDRASGDLRFFTILKMLAHDYRVVLLVLNNEDGDASYEQMLNEIGIETFRGYSSLNTIFARYRFCAVFCEFYFVAEHCIHYLRLKQPGLPLIVDSVDVHFYREQLKHEVTGDAADLRRAKATKIVELWVYRMADLVITVTRDDAKVIEATSPRIRTAVVPNIHTLEIPPDGNVRDLNRLVFVGSFRHQPNADALTYFLKDVLPLVWKENPKVHLDVIGANPPEDLIGMADPQRVRFLGFVPSVTPYLHESGISVAPLRYGAGMKGKIGEALAHGIPVVTTEIGTQGMALQHERDIMVGQTAEDFARCILRLQSDAPLYHSVAAAGLDFIRSNFVPEAVHQQVVAALQQVRGRRIRRLSIPETVLFLTQYLRHRLRRKITREEVVSIK